MSGEQKAKDGTLLKRVPVIVRSWDGPNSRVGLEMDLSQMPWGPFDALGKRLSLLLPTAEEETTTQSPSESPIEEALRHVEHAADRCGEFAKTANENQELWLRSQETWEWVRKYLTSLWVDVEVEGEEPPSFHEVVLESKAPNPSSGSGQEEALPALPGAAATLRMAARALKATPLAVWRDSMESADPDSPTREEAVQTLLGVARILGRQPLAGGSPASTESAPAQAHNEAPPPDPAPSPEEDPDQVSFDFAKGYDDGYQMGRRVGLALGAKRKPKDGSRDR